MKSKKNRKNIKKIFVGGRLNRKNMVSLFNEIIKNGKEIETPKYIYTTLIS